MQGPAGKYPTLQVHPYRRCNLRCLHCYTSSAPEVSERLDIDVLRPAVADAASLGYRVMSVSGGEPLLYSDLGNLLHAARVAGMVTTVTTNGMLLDDRRIEVLSRDCNLVAVSLDGVPESHDFIRGATGAFDRMSARLDGLRQSRIPFGFIFTLTFHNVHELDWVARFAVEQGASLLQLHPLEPVGRAVDEMDGSVPDGEENAAAVFEVLRLREQYRDVLEIQVDIATIPALLEHPTRVFVRDAALCEEQTVAEVISPLVIETSGVVSPLQYGFPSSWSWGNIKDRRLPDMAGSWLAHRYPAFLDLCRMVYDDLVANEAEPAVNWYHMVNRAATAHAPADLHDRQARPVLRAGA